MDQKRTDYFKVGAKQYKEIRNEYKDGKLPSLLLHVCCGACSCFPLVYLIDLFDRKVDIKRQHLPQVLCIDEVYAKKLAKYSYCCVLYSPQLRKIIDVLDSRRKIDLVDYFAKIPIDEKNKVKFISMDLWDSYREIAKLCLPNAKISADPFHVVKNLTECFTKIRITWE